MRPIILTASLVCTVLACSTNPRIRQPKFPANQELLDSWQTFKHAVNNSDTATLMSISHSCILCGPCSAPHDDRFISAEEFYRTDFRTVFDNRFLSMMNDSSKVWADYDNHSTYPERDSCLTTNA